ncbi:MAG: hypothetical protein ABUL46_05250 [Chitinophaga rupis]
METSKRSILLLIAIFSLSFANAQLEISHLSTRGFSTNGIGAFFNWGMMVNKGDVITFEPGFTYFNHTAVLTPSIFVGYRHTFTGKGYGLYIEPQLAYMFGAANIPEKDTTEFPSLGSGNGYIRQPQLSGPTAALGFGYIFPGKFAFNLGMRYEHIFVVGDPAVNILSLRLAHTFVLGRSRWYKGT